MTERAGPGPTRQQPLRHDFLVSHAPADLAWAHWVGWTLESAGYRIHLQEWDSVPGTVRHRQLDEAIRRADRTIALLSPEYLRTSSDRWELWPALWSDTDGAARKLIPVRIAACQATGILGAIVSFDLFGLAEDSAREKLLNEMKILRAGRAKPAAAPPFPPGPASVPASAAGQASLTRPLIRLPRRVALERVARLPHGNALSRISRSDWVGGLAFASSPRLLATGSDDTLSTLWDLSDPRQPTRLTRLRDHDDWVRAVAFSPDGRQLVTGGASGTVVARAVGLPTVPSAPRRLLGHRAPIWACAYSPSGDLLATADDDGCVLLWRPPDETTNSLVRPLGAIHLPGMQVGALAFSGDGRTLVAGVADGVVRLWRLGTSHDAPPGLDVEAVPLALTDHRAGVWAVAVSPDGTVLATGSDDGTVGLWDLSDPRRPERIASVEHGRWVRTVAFSATGTLLAVAGDGGVARLWDVSHPPLPACATLIGDFGGRVLSAAFAPALPAAPELLALGCSDGYVRVFAVHVG